MKFFNNPVFKRQLRRCLLEKLSPLRNCTIKFVIESIVDCAINHFIESSINISQLILLNIPKLCMAFPSFCPSSLRKGGCTVLLFSSITVTFRCHFIIFLEDMIHPVTKRKSKGNYLYSFCHRLE